MVIILSLLLYTTFITAIFGITFVVRRKNGYSFNKDVIPNKMCLILIFIPLFFVQTFKSTNSLKDLPTYEAVFEEVKTSSLVSLFSNNFDVGFSQEPGYILLNKLVSLVSDNVHALYGVVGFILLYCYAKSIYKLSPIVPLSCFLFVIVVYNQSLFVLRQHISIAIMIYSLQYIINRDLKRFSMFFFLSFLIHFTSIVFLPLYFLYGMKSEKKLLVILFLSFFVIKFGMLVILNYAVAINGAYRTYLDADSISNYKVSLLLFGVLLVRWLYTKKHFWEIGETRLFSLILTLGFIFYFCGIGFSPTGRLFMGYQMALCIALPQSLIYIKPHGVRYWVASAFLAGMLVSYIGGLEEVEGLKLSIL